MRSTDIAVCTIGLQQRQWHRFDDAHPRGTGPRNTPRTPALQHDTDGNRTGGTTCRNERKYVMVLICNEDAARSAAVDLMPQSKKESSTEVAGFTMCNYVCNFVLMRTECNSRAAHTEGLVQEVMVRGRQCADRPIRVVCLRQQTKTAASLQQSPSCWGAQTI